MEILSSLAQGFDVALTFQNLGLALLGCFLGTIIGAMPGLGPSNGVAILIPLAFTLGLPATPALILLTSVYYGAMYGGRISSILINIPGDEPALMSTLDGYPMAQQGRAGEALALSGLASFVGSFVATIGVALFAPLLVQLALLFGPAEYFALFTLAFATLGGVSSKNQAKAAMAAALGLGIAMVGIDGSTGAQRFTFGQVHLLDGIDFLVAIVGLFAISEVLLFMEHKGEGSPIGAKLDRPAEIGRRKGVVDQQGNFRIMRDGGDLWDIEHLEAGIADGLADNQPRIGLDRRAKFVQRARLYECRGDAEWRCVLRQPLLQSPVHDVRGDDEEVRREGRPRDQLPVEAGPDDRHRHDPGLPGAGRHLAAETAQRQH